MNLEKFGVKELNNVEMQTIEGGSWLGDAWNAVCDAASAVGEAISNAAEAVGEFLHDVACGVSRYGC